MSVFKDNTLLIIGTPAVSARRPEPFLRTDISAVRNKNTLLPEDRTNVYLKPV